MIDKEIREQIIALIHKEVVPAIGCTEPIAIAYAAAKARTVLGALPFGSSKVQPSSSKMRPSATFIS